MAGHVERAVGIDPAADAGDRCGVYIGLHHLDFAAAQEVDRGDARMKRRKSNCCSVIVYYFFRPLIIKENFSFSPR